MILNVTLEELEKKNCDWQIDLYTRLHVKLDKTSITWARFGWCSRTINGQLVMVLHSLVCSSVYITMIETFVLTLLHRPITTAVYSSSLGSPAVLSRVPKRNRCISSQVISYSLNSGLLFWIPLQKKPVTLRSTQDLNWRLHAQQSTLRQIDQTSTIYLLIKHLQLIAETRATFLR